MFARFLIKARPLHEAWPLRRLDVKAIGYAGVFEASLDIKNVDV